MASRRLNKSMREVFVKAVMNDVPKPDEDLCSKEFQAILYKSMPAEVQAVFNLCPEWIENHSHGITGWVETDRRGNRYRHHMYLRYKWHTYGVEEMGKEAQQYISRLQERCDERCKFEERLFEIVEGVNTIKDLKTVLPEFAKYAPDDTPAPTKNLPLCSNLMAEVVQLGWPGGKIVNAEVVTA